MAELDFEQEHQLDVIEQDLNDIRRDDEGLADIYIRHFHDTLLISNVKGDGYLWDASALLWKSASHKECKHALHVVLEPRLQVLQELVAANVEGEDNHDDIDDLRRDVDRALHQVLTSRGVAGVFECVLAKLVDDSVEQRMNQSDPDCLPIAGGLLISLRTGDRRERTQGDLWSFECPVQYLADDEQCGDAMQFFQQICVEDEQYMHYLLEVLGYAMTQHYRERAFFVCWGRGRNGKTTLFNLMRRILGSELQRECSKEVFLRRKHALGKEAATPNLMTLRGARCVTVTETDDNEELDSTQVKRLTGGDPVTGRQLYRKPETFVCEATIFMLTNTPPRFDNSDQAMRDRLRMLPFLARFSMEGAGNSVERWYPQDDEFVRRLGDESLSQVFSVLCRGAMQWFTNGEQLPAYPDICQRELNAWIASQDVVAQFVAERCQRSAAGAKVPCGEFHREFQSWCQRGGIIALSVRKIPERMALLGFERRKSGVQCYFGLALLPEY